MSIILRKQRKTTPAALMTYGFTRMCKSYPYGFTACIAAENPCLLGTIILHSELGYRISPMATCQPIHDVLLSP